MKFIKEKYKQLTILEKQRYIKTIKDKFERKLAKELDLVRVSAPLLVTKESGLQDDLSGVERKVSFDILKDGKELEIVQSLAKWKRMALKKYNFGAGTGLYTDMNAIRRDENTDALHSLYVDQWDWEKVISESDRNIEYLKEVVNDIYKVIYKIGVEVENKYPKLKNTLPKDIQFINSSELEKMYPNLTQKERENQVTKEYGAVFLNQIGWPLDSGTPHDGRAPDYDDWLLNGDILVWDEELNLALELSSMGIRVNAESLQKQVEYVKKYEKLENEYAQEVLNNTLPLTIGGGIGQSRLCMFFLKKKHIGEVQVSIWKDEDIIELSKQNINLL